MPTTTSIPADFFGDDQPVPAPFPPVAICPEPEAEIVIPTTWTKETIYRSDALEYMDAWVHMPPKLDRSDIRALRQWGSRSNHGQIYTPSYAHEIVREDNWQRVAKPVVPAIDAETAEQIGLKEINCPACHGAGVLYALHHGATTGLEIMLPVQTCVCRGLRSIWHYLADDKVVPPRFRRANLKDLEPSDLSTLGPERQQEIIALMRAHPADSYHLYGAPGTGKTHLMSALYRHALGAWAKQEMRQCDGVQAVWRCRTTTLLQEHIAWDTRGDDNPNDVSLPTVTVRRIQAARAAGYKPCLYLDELDKCKATEFQIGRLAELIDEVYAQEGQVVATSNKNFDHLCGKWGDDEAGTILRRIGAGPGAHSVRFVG